MARTFLQLVQQAANEIGIPEPSLVVSGQDETSRQLLALANREGKVFSALANFSGGWQALHKEYTFNTVVGKNNYALPSDFEYFVERSFYDNSTKWELMGPITAQEKQVLKYGVLASGPRPKWYVRNNQIYLVPTPEDVHLCAFDYYSNAWCASAGGTAQSLWGADDDVYLLDEDCFVLGLKWRFLRSKGLDYAQEKMDYDLEVQRVISRDGGSRDLPLGSPIFSTRLLNDSNIPETGFGV